MRSSRNKYGFGMVMIAIMALSAGTVRVRAAEEPARHWTTALDIFLPGSADSRPKDAARERADRLVSGGYDSASFDVDSKTGVGARIGYMAPAKGFEVGPSLGYVLGSRVSTKVDGQSTLVGNGSVDTDQRTQYLRLLAEGRKRFWMGSDWSLNLGAGLGIAYGDTHNGVSTAGSIGGLSSGSHSATGITWEITPSVSYKAFDLGLRYAGFPTIGSTASSDAIRWTTIGFFVGAGF